MLVEIRMCFPVRALSRFERELLPRAVSKSMKKCVFLRPPFWSHFLRKGCQKGCKKVPFWMLFGVLFWKRWFSQNWWQYRTECLLLLAQGSPKRFQKSMKKGFRKLPLILDRFFAKSAPKGSPEGARRGSKIHQKSMSWPTWRPQGQPVTILIDFWSIWGAFWTPNWRFLEIFCTPKPTKEQNLPNPTRTYQVLSYAWWSPGFVL